MLASGAMQAPPQDRWTREKVVATIVRMSRHPDVIAQTAQVAVMISVCRVVWIVVQMLSQTLPVPPTTLRGGPWIAASGALISTLAAVAGTRVLCSQPWMKPHQSGVGLYKSTAAANLLEAFHILLRVVVGAAVGTILIEVIVVLIHCATAAVFISAAWAPASEAAQGEPTLARQGTQGLPTDSYTVGAIIDDADEGRT